MADDADPKFEFEFSNEIEAAIRALVVTLQICGLSLPQAAAALMGAFVGLINWANFSGPTASDMLGSALLSITHREYLVRLVSEGMKMEIVPVSEIVDASGSLPGKVVH
ncbi:MAG: hypothetical protein MUC88_00405 [Planctomycetes bacterium]|jgi:hypothetical protein|nr:hypothetical protein [Planctomycetota bacterium]